MKATSGPASGLLLYGAQQLMQLMQFTQLVELMQFM